MIIDVWFHGLFYTLAGRKKVFTLDDKARLADLVELISNAYGKAMQDLLDAKESYFILINGRYSDLIKDQKRKLNEGDTVAFVTIVSGG